MTVPIATDLRELLVCPVDRTPITAMENWLRCDEEHTYPIVGGVPVLLPGDLEPTLPDVFAATREALDGTGPSIRLEVGTDEFIRQWIVRTNGNLYRRLTGLPRLPIARFPIRCQGRERVLDVGGNWGRWSLGAARDGFEAIVVDPNLEATLVGTAAAQAMGLPVHFIVGDARALPIAEGAIDIAFSYSVLQHFDKVDTGTALREMGRTARSGGRVLVQMPNAFGVRQATNRLRQRGARATNPFRVRYWTPRELTRLGRTTVGPTKLAVDGYFSLNPRPEDLDFLPTEAAFLVRLSESLKAVTKTPGGGWLRWLADSLWLDARVPPRFEPPLS